VQRIEFRAMGCHMLALTGTDSPAAQQALSEVPAWFEAWEQCLSRFRPDSELSRLNQSAGAHSGWFETSETLWQVLQLSLDAARDSDGLVSPTMLGALEAAGYDRSFDVIRTSFATLTIGQPIQPGAGADWHAVELDAARQAVRLPAGARIDLGGVAKGWAAGQAARRLSACGAALVDAGGDIAAYGASSAPFPIGVASPWKPGENLDLIMLGEGGVATSGRDYRRWTFGGKVQHHIIDPRIGLPAATDVLSATVIAPSAPQAEVAAKVALILGSAAGLDWIEARPALAALLTTEFGDVYRSTRFAAHTWQPPAVRTHSATG
jgi:FAD:protein FMN transferase